MKTFLTRSKSKYVILTLLSFPVWSAPVAQVTELTGQVFVITSDGSTRKLKISEHLEEKSEVMVEEGATITLNDYYDATYHLVGGSHMKFFNKSVQLKRGKTWIQAHNPGHRLALTTANGHVDFWKSEFITTFDATNSRSQVLVVNGDVEVSNVLDREMKHAVPAGTFSLIDPDVENGVPRFPTKVGLASLNSALAEFKRLPEEMVSPQAAPKAILKRSIASAAEEAAPVKKGEIIFITSHRVPASVAGSARDYFVKKSKVNKRNLTTAPIKFYGVATGHSSVMGAPAVKVKRVPASIPTAQISPQKVVEKINLDSEFGDTLKEKSIEQPKYSKELERLIQDLKSY